MVKKGIPDRWHDYSNMGRCITGTRFICFKVPLDQKYERQGSDFSCRELIDYCPNLGLVIDLTNTTRYYSPQDLNKQHVKHKKIFTEGHVVPSRSVVKQFINAVNDFLDENSDNDKLIGVHCTHGVNRTGYLVCRYMIQILGIAPDQAIVDFESARHHNIERANYTDDLREAKWVNEDHSRYEDLKGTINTTTPITPSRDTNLNRSTEEPSYGYGYYGQRSSGRQQQQEEGEDDEEGVGRRRRSFGKRRSGGVLRTPDSSDFWKVSDNSKGGGGGSPGDATPGKEVTPRGTKRDRSHRRLPDDEDDDGQQRPSKRAPWFGAAAYDRDEEVLREHANDVLLSKRRKRRQQMDKNYSHYDQDHRYDPFFYKQKPGGGPTRVERQYADNKGPSGSRYGAGVKQYKGPRWYKNRGEAGVAGGKEVEDKDESLGLDDHEPLKLPDDVDHKGLFEDAPLFEHKKGESKSPGREGEKVFSPETADAKKKRRSQRYLPY